MGKTSIEWTDASWNPVVGCTEVSPGCANCYAARLAATRLKNLPDYKGLAVIHEGRYVSSEKPSVNCSHWEGEVRFLENRLEEPLSWRKPRRIFVCDMGDLFHESVPDSFIKLVWQVMAKCPQHTFQILTKRAKRMSEWTRAFYGGITYPHIWLGVSVENQHFADERIPLLSDTPAAVRFLSCEPLLGPLNLRWFTGIHWVICGGESGANARPMNPEWVHSLRDQCDLSNVPFFFKQWGEWGPPFAKSRTEYIGTRWLKTESGYWLTKIGKKKAGRELDGREWNEFPQAPK